MATFQVYSAAGELNMVTGNYYGLSPTTKSATKLVMTDKEGDKIIYTGTGFTYNGSDPNGGTVTKVQFVNAAGDTTLQITNGSFKLGKMSFTDLAADFELFEAGHDTMKGSALGDMLLYGSNKGNDTILGLGGDDYIQGSDGKDDIDGGSGKGDVLTFQWTAYTLDSGATRGIDVNAGKGTMIDAWGNTDTIAGIEEFRGTNFVDKMIGSAADEIFSGDHGNDRFSGMGGADTLVFAPGSDKDTFVDFKSGTDEILFFMYAKKTLTQLKAMMTEKNGDVILNMGSGDTITFLDTSKADFHTGDFLFQ